MARDRNGSAREEEIGAREDGEEKFEKTSAREHHQKAKRRKEEGAGDSSGGSDGDRARGKKRKRKGRRSSSGSRRRGSDSESDEDSSYPDSYSESETDSDGDSESDSELRRRKKKERRRKEREQEKERRRRKERRRKREKEERRRRKERKKEKEEKKNKKKEKGRGTKGAVTNSWGKFGVIKETDMWNKRPEFNAWLAEIKQVNLETLSNWEEKQLFKQFMEDHNTATFPSKKYYNLDAYYRRKMENELKKGVKKVVETERTNFNDEEQRRQELLLEREKQKAEKVDELKRSMQSGMAQAMKDQARLKEEMAYQYKLGNFEAAAAIQRRLDPDVPM